jgi:hypothetical protein
MASPDGSALADARTVIAEALARRFPASLPCSSSHLWGADAIIDTLLERGFTVMSLQAVTDKMVEAHSMGQEEGYRDGRADASAAGASPEADRPKAHTPDSPKAKPETVMKLYEWRGNVSVRNTAAEAVIEAARKLVASKTNVQLITRMADLEKALSLLDQSGGGNGR